MNNLSDKTQLKHSVVDYNIIYYSVHMILFKQGKLGKMLNSMKEKIRKWKVERTEKTFAQLKRENERLIQQVNEILKGTNDEMAPDKLRCDSNMNGTRVDHHKRGMRNKN